MLADGQTIFDHEFYQKTKDVRLIHIMNVVFYFWLSSNSLNFTNL